jgi:hypothetical protein
MSRRRTLLVVSTALVLVAGGVQAAKTVDVTRIDGAQVRALPPAGPALPTASWGNLNAPAFEINNWIYGDEEYAYFFEAASTECSCPLGFHLDTVHMLVQFEAEDLPSVFEAYSDLTDAVWNPVTLCWEPGETFCTSLTYAFEITEPGIYDLAVPIHAECECAFLDYGYFLSFHFVTAFDPAQRPDAIADAQPLGCTSFNNYGFGWEDLVTVYGWPGEILIWADASCCEEPVASEPRTWGGVKKLYR